MQLNVLKNIFNRGNEIEKVERMIRDEQKEKEIDKLLAPYPVEGVPEEEAIENIDKCIELIDAQEAELIEQVEGLQNELLEWKQKQMDGMDFFRKLYFEIWFRYHFRKSMKKVET